MLQDFPLRRAARHLAAVATLFVAACGGGGGGGGGSPDSASLVTGSQVIPPSSSLANVCTVEGQKQWVRSYLNEVYLWADEIHEVESSAYATPASYFDALLVRTPDANGLPRDRFSTTMSASAANALQGITAASNPAAAAAAAATNPVPLVRTLTSTGGRQVGYILFNQHTRGAQDALIDAFTQMRNAAVQDLVLDLRYNAGGFLYVAQAAASMVTGPSADGRLFEGVQYNARRDERNDADAFLFGPQVTTAESAYGAGHALPRLSLPRLYVLTSQLTCSASESIINGLRGIGVQVILVGDRTCGKPYGFHRMDNCGQAYFPIEFHMVNAAGFGDYTAGFPVQCRVQENPFRALGAANEPLLAAALRHADTGSCPAGTATGVMAMSTMGATAQPIATASPLDRPGAPGSGSPMYQPGFDGRVLRP